MPGTRPPNNNALDPITLSRPLNVNNSRNIELSELGMTGADFLKAAEREDNEKINKLLDRGVRPTETDRYGNTVLHLVINGVNATLLPDSTAIRIAEDPRVDVNAKNIDGTTPLMLTTDRTESITKALLARGADINAVNNEGFSALERAILRSRVNPSLYTQKAILLIKAGAALSTDGLRSISPMRRNPDNSIVIDPIYEAILLKKGGRRRKTRKARKTHNNRKNRKHTHKKN